MFRPHRTQLAVAVLVRSSFHPRPTLPSSPHPSHARPTSSVVRSGSWTEGWRQAACYMPRPRYVRAGEAIWLLVIQSKVGIRFEEIPRTTASAVPRPLPVQPLGRHLLQPGAQVQSDAACNQPGARHPCRRPSAHAIAVYVAPWCRVRPASPPQRIMPFHIAP